MIPPSDDSSKQPSVAMPPRRGRLRRCLTLTVAFVGGVIAFATQRINSIKRTPVASAREQRREEKRRRKAMWKPKRAA